LVVAVGVAVDGNEAGWVDGDGVVTEGDAVGVDAPHAASGAARRIRNRSVGIGS
jgi:hypothetical protein